SLPLRRRSDYIAATLADVKRAWDDHGAGAAYLAALQDVGAELFDQLFPEKLRALLWANRAQLSPVVLRADEPDVPWELVHLKPPKGQRQQAPMFLGQLGLLRWPFDGYPQATLRARPGKVRVLCPDQTGSASPGAGGALEAEFLEQQLGAKPLDGTESALRTLLRGGDFDLLHFSGHGVADPLDSSSAKLVLTRATGGGGVEKLRYLTARAVEQNAKLRRDDGSGPLVVLNACQLARGGDQLTGSGGFAKAFLATGAAAYVAALWSIHDTPAHDFVTELYTHLLGGATVADAAAAARQKARASGDATWLSYVIYARPDARLVRV
ncbi:MAG: CHAT domain-containing protein, partial [Candidatus Phosphoribacter baldrii]